MLIIRDAQMRTFQSELNQRFSWKLLPEIKKIYPRNLPPVTDLELSKQLAERILHAQSYGFTEDRDIGAFVKLTFVISPNFDKLPVFKPILRDTNLVANDRMRCLLMAARGNKTRNSDTPHREGGV